MMTEQLMINLWNKDFIEGKNPEFVSTLTSIAILILVKYCDLNNSAVRSQGIFYIECTSCEFGSQIAIDLTVKGID